MNSSPNDVVSVITSSSSRHSTAPTLSEDNVTSTRGRWPFRHLTQKPDTPLTSTAYIPTDGTHVHPSSMPFILHTQSFLYYAELSSALRIKRHRVLNLNEDSEMNMSRLRIWITLVSIPDLEILQCVMGCDAV